MGVSVLLLASLGTSLLGTIQQQEGIAAQAEAQQAELLRQEELANVQAAEDKSDTALRMDKAAARVRAAMEAIGGFGSINDERSQAEIAGLKGLNLARIESNRLNKTAGIRASAAAVRAKSQGAIDSASFAFLGTALGTAGAFGLRAEEAAAADERNNALRGFGRPSGLPPLDPL